MASVSFYLNKGKTDRKGRQPIYLQFDHNKERFRYYTGEKIDPKYWSKSKTSYVKPSYNDDSVLDSYLKKLESRVYDIIREVKTDNRIVTVELVKEEFLRDSNQDIDQTFFPLFDEYLKACVKAPRFLAPLRTIRTPYTTSRSIEIIQAFNSNLSA